VDVGAPPAGTDLSLFDDVPQGELEEAFARLEVRRHAVGSVVIAEGDMLQELYIVRRGSADVFVADRQGVEHRVGQVAAGATLGEMSLLTAQPAAGTVRATEDVELLVIGKEEFDRLGARFPQIYRNVGSILAERLARTNRLALGEEPGRLAVLLDRGAPPLLGHAIASSVAWHTRSSSVLLVVTEQIPDELAPLALEPSVLDHRPERDGARPGVVLVAVPPVGRFTGGALGATVQALLNAYDNVLLQVREAPRGDLHVTRTIELRAAGDGATAPGGAAAYTVEAWATSIDERVGPDSRGVVSVPALEPADDTALKRGLLPSSTAAGKTIGWIARDLAGLKVGLALGAGSVRGFAHFGVLRVLERVGLHPDCVAGTSAGAAAGALYALGHPPDEAAQIFLRCGPTLFRPTISSKSFLSNRGVRKFVQRMAGDKRIEDLPVPFAAVAADIETQREIVFRRGPVWQAVLASLTIPGIYPALRIGAYSVVDGGVLNPVPCSVANEMGAGVVVGVKLGTTMLAADLDAEAERESGRPHSAIVAILRSTELMQSRLVPEVTDAKTVIITPEIKATTGGSLRSFKQGIGFVEDGEAAAEAALPRVAAALPWLRG
jgi:NTE family protein